MNQQDTALGRPLFRDRTHAAALLLERLAPYRGQHPLVLGIPRGGVPMARQIADGLGGELDVVLVRKLGAPGNPEYAIGALSEAGDVSLNPDAPLDGLRDYLQEEVAAQRALLRERRALYTPQRKPVAPEGRVVIVVDDGSATGATMLAALRTLRPLRPKTLIAALPVCPPSTAARLEREADRVVALETPRSFGAVGAYYRRFGQVNDDAVVAALRG